MAETSRLWAEFRLAVVGHLVVGDLDRGQLGAELKSLSAKEWKHPITGTRVTFGYSTIERWYYVVLNNPKARLRALSKKRRDAGLPRSLTKQMRHYLARQAKRHSSWSYHRHHQTLVRYMWEREWGRTPGYSTILRYLRSIFSSQNVSAVGAKIKRLEGLVVHLRRTLIVESTIIRLLRVPELRAKTVGSQGSGRAKKPTFFLVFETISQLAARNPSFALALAFRRALSNGGEHHTGDMARQDSAREHDASGQIKPVLGRPRYEYWRSSTVSRAPMASIGQAGLEKA